MVKYALLVGLNYPDEEKLELNASYNDVLAVEKFLIEQGYKVNRKHGGQIKTKPRPKPKILQNKGTSKYKRAIGVGAATCGYGAVRRV